MSIHKSKFSVKYFPDFLSQKQGFQDIHLACKGANKIKLNGELLNQDSISTHCSKTKVSF